MSKIIVHNLNMSRSQRVLWLLEELGLDYDIELYQRDPKTMFAPPELQEIHPLGKSPVIQDGELVLAETGAIIEYLVEKYGDGRLAPPPGTPERIRYLYWLHYAEGSLMPPLLVKLIFNRIETSPMPFFARPIARKITKTARATFTDPQLKRHFDYLEAERGNTAWFAGEEFTAADIMMSFPLQVAVLRAALDSSRPNLSGFLERVKGRPGYQVARERGGGLE